MATNEHDAEQGANGPSISYKRALVESAPLIALLLALSVVGYHYATSWWWVVVFVFGSIAVFTNRVYYQKTLNLRERLRR